MNIKEKSLFLKMLQTQGTKEPLITIVTKGPYTPIFSIENFQLESKDTDIKEESLVQEFIPEVSIAICNDVTIQKYASDKYKLLGFDMNTIREVEIDGFFVNESAEQERKKKFIGGLRPVIIKYKIA